MCGCDPDVGPRLISLGQGRLRVSVWVWCVDRLLHQGIRKEDQGS